MGSHGRRLQHSIGERQTAALASALSARTRYGWRRLRSAANVAVKHPSRPLVVLVVVATVREGSATLAAGAAIGRPDFLLAEQRGWQRLCQRGW